MQKNSKYLTPKRLDIVIKALYFEELKSGFNLFNVEDLYKQHIMKRTGGIEPTDYLGQKSGKNNIEDYISRCKWMLANYGATNFTIPVSSGGEIVGGAHRLGLALSLKQDFDIVEEPLIGGGLWDFEWFKNHDFSQEDLLRILWGYIRYKENTAVLMMWFPINKIWNDLKECIGVDANIVGSVEIGFDCSKTLHSMGLDMYGCLDKSALYDKFELLEQYEPRINVLVLEFDPKTWNAQIIKNRWRDFCNDKIPTKRFLNFHMSNDRQESLRMADIILSSNNLLYLKNRKTVWPHDKFLEWLKEISNIVLAEKEISMSDICITGSGSMEIMGIREANDVDFTVSSFLRSVYGNVSNHLREHIHVVMRGYHRTLNGKGEIGDDFLIDGPDWHFNFRGFKFVNLSIVRDRKYVLNRPKDIVDIGLIKEWEIANQEIDIDVRVLTNGLGRGMV